MVKGRAGVMSSCCDRVSPASESIPSRRHQVKKPPTEQSIGVPSCTSRVNEEAGQAFVTVVSLPDCYHLRSGEVECLVTFDRFEPLDLYGAVQDD
jgi:hypothetical protein